MLDVKLVRSIREGKYDPWSESLNSFQDDRKRYSLQRFDNDDELGFVKAKKWRRIVAWDLGKLAEPNAMVILKYRYIETGWGESKNYSGLPKRYCVTPVYQVTGTRESHDDYSVEVEMLQRRIDSGDITDATLVYDASGSGSAVSQQIRHLQGFERIIPVIFTTGTEIKRQNGFVVEGRSRLLADLEQVVKQRRIRIPDKQSTEKLNRQLVGMRVEETVQGHYRDVDKRPGSHHHDLLIALGMGITYVETIAAKISGCGGY